MANSIASSLTDFDDWLDFGRSSVQSLALDDVLKDVELLDDSVSFVDGSDAASLACTSSGRSDSFEYTIVSVVSVERLESLSHQLTAIESKGGSAHCIAEHNGKLAIGTMKGMILLFNSQHCLDHFVAAESDTGAVVCLSFSKDGRWLVAGFSKGLVKIIKSSNGHVAYVVKDAIQPGRGLLQLVFLESSGCFLALDTGGNVFEITLRSSIARRKTHHIRCVFSGCNGEVVYIRVLPNFLLALLTISKVLIVSTRGGGAVLCAFPIRHCPSSPPLCDFWKDMQISVKHEFYLCLARGDKLSVFVVHPGRLGTKQKAVAMLRMVLLPFNAVALHWISNNGILVFDESGVSALIDPERGTVHKSPFDALPLVFGTSDYKGLSTGGAVSEALSILAESICYNSIVRTSPIFAVHALSHDGVFEIRTLDESEQVARFQRNGEFSSACLYLIDIKRGRLKCSVRFKEKIHRILEDALLQLTTFALSGINGGPVPELISHLKHNIRCLVFGCVEGNRLDLFYDEIWPRIEVDQLAKGILLELMDEWVLDGAFMEAPPSLVAAYIENLAAEGNFSQLQAAVLRFSIYNIDLHMVMSVCRQNGLYDGVIHIMNKALIDYLSPLEEMLETVGTFASREVLTDSEVEQGNRLLLYIHCCLAGNSYPFGQLPENLRTKVPLEVFRCIGSLRGKNGMDNSTKYPYLRLLLQFDSQQFLHVISTCADAPLFQSEGRLQRFVEVVGMICSELGLLPALSNFLLLVIRLVECHKFVPPDPVINNCILVMLRLPNLTEASEHVVVDVLRAFPEIDKDSILRCALHPLRPHICTFVLSCQRRFTELVKCYLESKDCKEKIFERIRAILTSDLTVGELSEFTSFVRTVLPEICTINSRFAAELILDHFPDYLAEVATNEIEEQLTSFSLLHNALILRHDRQERIITGNEEHDEALFCSIFRGLVEIENFSDDQLKEVLNFWLPFGSTTDYCLNIATAAGKTKSSVLLLEARGLPDRAFQEIFREITSAENSSEMIPWLDELLSLCTRHSAQANQKSWLLSTFRKLTTSQHDISSVELDNRVQLLVRKILSAGTEHAYELLQCLLDYKPFSGGMLSEYSELINDILNYCKFDVSIQESLLKCMESECSTSLSAYSSLLSTRTSGLVEPKCLLCNLPLTRATYLFRCGHAVHVECDHGSKLCPCTSKSTGTTILTRERGIRSVPSLNIKSKDIFTNWNSTLKMTPQNNL